MFYSVASPDWTPGRPLTPSGALLFRTRAEAEAFAPEGQAVVVAVRFDAGRAEVRALRPGRVADGWRASAVANALGGLTVFGAIPTELVRPLFEAESTAGAALPAVGDPSDAALAGFGGWDSLTMALLA